MATERDQRGFAVFGTFRDRCNALITVKESSDTEGNVWVYVSGGQVQANDGAALLSPTNARRLARLLLEGAEYVDAGPTSEGEESDA